MKEAVAAMSHRVISTNSMLPGVQTLEILSDRHFPRHSHDQYGIGVMIEGAHKSWSGRGQVEAGPNHVITVYPGEMHDGRPIGGASRRWRMLFIDPNLVARFAGKGAAAREFTQPAIADADLARRVDGTLLKMPHLSADEALESVLDLVGTLVGEAEVSKSESRPSTTVRAVLDRIHDDPVNAPSLSELAALAGLNEYSLLRRFRRELGTTPHAYVLQYRVRRAYHAISTGTSLIEAAAQAGFSDQSHMTRSFARQLGLTPGQCRPRQDPNGLRHRPSAYIKGRRSFEARGKAHSRTC